MGLNPIGGNLGTLLAIPGGQMEEGKWGQQFKNLTSTWVEFQIVLSLREKCVLKKYKLKA